MPSRDRISKVLHYIDEHLDESLTLAELSAVACCSKFHFHRQFMAHCGVTVAEVVRLLKLKRAAYQLAFRPQLSVTDIALARQ